MSDPTRFIARWHQFAGTSLDPLYGAAHEAEAAAHAVDLFHAAAREVPAYARFLREQGVDPHKVRSAGDLALVPPTTKDNYAKRSTPAEMCRGGRIEAGDMFAASSGSTGEPTFWLRSAADELDVARRFEQVFCDGFGAATKPTLAVVCFALGSWVGGMYTTACCRHLAAKGHPVTTLAPGSNKEEILRAVERIGPQFAQVVLLGYPPFLKDVVDTGRARGFDWARHGIRIVTAGEVFSEEWRELMWERTGRAGTLDAFCASLYGTADGGVLGNETPLSVRIRQFLARTPAAAREFFGEARLPTLVQYDPGSRFFQEHEGRMVFTADGTMPLVRYDILDTGGVTGFDEMLEFLAAHKFDPRKDANGAPIRALPFVHVFGRTHFAVSYYGANIYPENVTVGLEQPAVREWVTGKFVLETAEGADHDAVLRVTVELAPGAGDEAGRAQAAAEAIRDQLLRLNSEFANYAPPARQLPDVRLRPAGDPEYFPPGVKHRYTRG